MARRTVFYDENNNELDCYINDKGKIYIGVGQKEEDYYSGFITLDKEDVSQLIKLLVELKEEMAD